MENGLFRYDLSEVKTRIVPGMLQYVTQVDLIILSPNVIL